LPYISISSFSCSISSQFPLLCSDAVKTYRPLRLPLAQGWPCPCSCTRGLAHV
jgi:hypothetical protein